MKDIQFIGIIENATNKQLGKDFGFILGTHLPFESSEHISSGLKEGFTVWKKNIDNSYTEINIKAPQSVSQNIKDIITFLVLDGIPLSIVFEIEKYK